MSSRMPFVFPLSLDRFILASIFARRICSGDATETELGFMNRYMDLELDEELLDARDDIVEFLCEFQ